jgi:hypothetical protein
MSQVIPNWYVHTSNRIPTLPLHPRRHYTNSVEVHPQLTNNRHLPVDGVLVGAKGSRWPTCKLSPCSRISACYQAPIVPELPSFNPSVARNLSRLVQHLTAGYFHSMFSIATTSANISSHQMLFVCGPVLPLASSGPPSPLSSPPPQKENRKQTHLLA